MNLLSNELDLLIEDSKTKNAQLENRKIVVKNKPCKHGPIISKLKKDVSDKEAQMVKIEDKIQTFDKGVKEQ